MFQIQDIVLKKRMLAHLVTEEWITYERRIRTLSVIVLKH